jgi:phosphatidylinositol-3-phosphatase
VHVHIVTEWRWLLAAAVVPLVIGGCTSTADRTAGTGSAAPGGHRGLSAVRHVWIIELENQGYAQSFGTPAADPYLAQALPRMGALLENYYGIGHASADNYIAQVSGQAPTLATQADCPIWIPFPGHAMAGPYHQVLGEGCVYPATVPTLGNQMSAAGRNWAAYLQDWAMTRAGTTRSAPLADRPAATPPPGPSTVPSAPNGTISTPPATTGSRSSARSPRTRPTAPRTSCHSGRCPATWPGLAPPRRSPSSRRTCATTATTRPAPTAPPAAWPRPTGSWRTGCRSSWPHRPTKTAD